MRTNLSSYKDRIHFPTRIIEHKNGTELCGGVSSYYSWEVADIRWNSQGALNLIWLDTVTINTKEKCQF